MFTRCVETLRPSSSNEQNPSQLEEKLRAATTFKLSLGLFVLLLTLSSVRHFLEPIDVHYSVKLFIGLSLASALASAFASRFFPLSWSARVPLVLSVYFILCPAGFFFGGLSAPVIPIIVVPLFLAAFLIGRSALLGFSLLSAGFIGVMFALTALEIIPASNLTPERTNVARAVVLLGILFIATFIAYMYETMRLRSITVSEEKRKLEQQKAELEAVKALIVTYNHEINNPLTIAMASLRKVDSVGEESQRHLDSASRALERVDGVVKKISVVTKEDLVLDQYTESTKMLKIAR